MLATARSGDRRPPLGALAWGGVRNVGMVKVSRRGLLRLAAAAAASAGVLELAGSGVAQAAPGGARLLSFLPSSPDDAPPPNVLLVTVDTLRADQLGCYGHPFVRTPALDALARQGARFAAHLVQQPQTNPSHASIFTGMYPSSSGVRVHMVDKLPDGLDTLAARFQQAGYLTAGLYSWLSFDPQYSNFQRGFQVYEDLTLNKPGLLQHPLLQGASAGYRTAQEYLVAPRLASQLFGLNRQVEGAAKGRADHTTDAAIAQLRAFGGAPFFLWLHYFDPHYPYEAPGEYARLYDPAYRGPIGGDMGTIYALAEGRLKPADADLAHLLALYQGEISYLDRHLGRLFAALDRLGLTRNTVVALTGDHGESFGEHAEFVQGGALFHPRGLYHAELRVPLLLRYPPRIAPGTVVAAPTQAIDLFPTLLALAGLPASEQAQGTSLLGLLDGADDGAGRAAYAAMPDYVFTAVAAGRWKLIQNNATGQRRLFDLVADPQETRDVLAARAEVGEQMTARLRAWMRAARIS
jgi:arylsulfatase